MQLLRKIVAPRKERVYEVSVPTYASAPPRLSKPDECRNQAMANTLMQVFSPLIDALIVQI